MIAGADVAVIDAIACDYTAAGKSAFRSADVDASEV